MDSHFQLVQSAIAYGHKKTHLLYGYVIMPDHVHVLCQPLPRINGWRAWCDYRHFYQLEEIFRNIKNYSARMINKTPSRKGSVWLSESFDRIIRNERDLSETLQYIHENPIRWNLVNRPEDYPWSSASTIYSDRAEYYGWFNLSDART